jgi:hypothetical protein
MQADPVRPRPPARAARFGPGSGTTLAVVVAFAVAFGWLEAAVVIYLREMFYPEGFDFPMHVLRADLGVVELVREAATIVMLAAVGVLGARTSWGRFGLFALAFGVWDLVYYVGLYIVLEWPAGLGTWDVLFLIPGVWTGPVWTAALIAVLLVGFGWVFFVRGEAGQIGALRPLHWGMGLASLALILNAFLYNHTLALEQGVPVDFPVMRYVAGIVLGVVAALDLLRAGSPRNPSKSPDQAVGTGSGA